MMLAVGVLVPLSHGRLGRGWRHAQNLQELARSISGCKKFTNDTIEHQILLDYYTAHCVPTPGSSPPLAQADSPSSLRYRAVSSRPYKPYPSTEAAKFHTRTRSISDTTLITTADPTTRLSPNHPALSLVEFLDTFGPLVFPLYRAALARKRILLITQAPVEKACNFGESCTLPSYNLFTDCPPGCAVYNISILSTLPFSVLSSISPSSSDLSRLRPLFSIGVHDLAFLEEYSHQRGQASYNNITSSESTSPWVACTTDEVLRLKSSLYDVVVTLPPPCTKYLKKRWPKIESPMGVLVKATQRDLRRYRKLRKGLEQYTMSTSPPGDVLESGEVDDYKTTSNDEEAACEKASWKELAYSGFLWWASAGEKRQDNNAEEDVDRVAPAIGRVNDQGEQVPLLDAFADEGADFDDNSRQTRASAVDTPPILSPQAPGPPGPQKYSSSGGIEMDIVAYFHRLTARFFEGMAEVIHSSGSEYIESDINEMEEEDADDAMAERRGLLDGNGFQSQSLTPQPADIWLSKDEMVSLGLDRWSTSDEKFVEEMGQRWWQRSVAVEKGGVCQCFC